MSKNDAENHNKESSMPSSVTKVLVEILELSVDS